MDERTLSTSIRKVLLSQRMISIQNLIRHLSSDIDSIRPILQAFELNGDIRIATSNSCGSTCSSCSACDTGKKSEGITITSTVVSHLYSRTEAYVD